jgi:hypothetical protein
MSNVISGFVKKTLRKLGLGGRRRKSVKAEGGRRRRKHTVKAVAGRRRKHTVKAGRRHRKH